MGVVSFSAALRLSLPRAPSTICIKLAAIARTWSIPVGYSAKFASSSSSSSSRSTGSQGRNASNINLRLNSSRPLSRFPSGGWPGAQDGRLFFGPPPGIVRACDNFGQSTCGIRFIDRPSMKIPPSIGASRLHNSELVGFSISGNRLSPRSFAC